MIKGGECLAEVLISLLREVHSIESSHKDAIEFDRLCMQLRGDMLQSLYSLFFGDLVFTIVQSYLAYIGDGGHIIRFAAGYLTLK